MEVIVVGSVVRCGAIIRAAGMLHTVLYYYYYYCPGWKCECRCGEECSFQGFYHWREVGGSGTKGSGKVVGKSIKRAAAIHKVNNGGGGKSTVCSRTVVIVIIILRIIRTKGRVRLGTRDYC